MRRIAWLLVLLCGLFLLALSMVSLFIGPYGWNQELEMGRYLAENYNWLAWVYIAGIFLGFAGAAFAIVQHLKLTHKPE